ncbi:MAG: hypothetical protein HYV39_04150 [Candidatus Levybacteria bacterium]|nr:hypothetical protein [Candidatus Levybacteria bacterium]
MNKHKKTRKEKMLADLHRKLQFQKQAQTFSTLSTSTYVPQQSMAITTSRPYSYLMYDLIKTSILTTGIIVGEFFLFYFLKTHIIKIPNLAY